MLGEATTASTAVRSRLAKGVHWISGLPVASPMWMKVSSIWCGIRMGLSEPISNSLAAAGQQDRTGGGDAEGEVVLVSEEGEGEMCH